MQTMMCPFCGVGNDIIKWVCRGCRERLVMNNHPAEKELEEQYQMKERKVITILDVSVFSLDLERWSKEVIWTCLLKPS